MGVTHQCSFSYFDAVFLTVVLYEKVLICRNCALKYSSVMKEIILATS